MSAVLQTPALRAPVNLENLTAYIDSEIKKGIDKAVIPLKTKIAYLEAELVEVKSGLDDNKELLAISLKRNTQLENAIFEHDSEGEILLDSDNQPVLNTPVAPEKSIEEKTPELPIIPSTTLEIKAASLVEYLKEDVKPRNGEVFLNSREIINYLKTEITEELRLKDIRNPRQAKKDILEKAVKLFSDTVLIIRNKSGNKVTGIALKPSVKCRYTDTCY
jgi:hypothetical protein